MHPSRILWTVLVLSLVSACTTVPETGRRQLQLIGPDQEHRLGLTEFEKIKNDTPLSGDVRSKRLLQRVGERISKTVDLPGAKWEFVLFDEPNVANAFCLPGGKVGVYSGMLAVTQDENGLATVVGHEIAHAVARHGAERMSEGLMVQFGGQALTQAMQNRPEAARSLVLSAYGIAGQVGVTLPHSRRQELEADHLGLMYMARAGYDPRGAVEFWRRFSDKEGKQGGRLAEFLSTHPLDSTRIAALKAKMPEALAAYQGATGAAR